MKNIYAWRRPKIIFAGLATENSLVLIDEVGRGTSVREGVAISHAIAEELIRLKVNLLCYVNGSSSQISSTVFCLLRDVGTFRVHVLPARLTRLLAKPFQRAHNHALTPTICGQVCITHA